MDSRKRRLVNDWLGFLAWLTGIAAILIFGGTRLVPGAGGAGREIWWGCLLSLAASIVGSLPILVAARSGRVEAGSLLGSLALRFLIVLGVAGTVALKGWLEPRAFLISVGVSYLAFLVADVRYAVRQQTILVGSEL